MTGHVKTLAVVHNNIDGQSAIGAIAEWAVRAGLERDWEVTVVCRDLEPTLQSDVQKRQLYVPPRAHLLQWSVARPTVRRALAGWRPDAMLVYQPQIAAIADVWHVEYLSRAARLAAGPRRSGLRGWSEDVQAAGVAQLEDRYLRRITDSTRVLFCSEGLQRQYHELFGPPPSEGVLHNPALLEVGLEHDAARRHELTGGHSGPVVGFLGGGDPRKGGDYVVRAVAADPDLFLLHAGPSPLDDSLIASRARNMGHLADVTELLDAIDVLLVPSRFEPFGMVVVEAAARGVPVLVSPGVGAGPLLVEAGAGAEWVPAQPLRPAINALLAHDTDVAAAGKRLVEAVDPRLLADQLFAHLDEAADRNQAHA
jgi:glycogen(starch) synthase